jgi:hypothetical protein
MHEEVDPTLNNIICLGLHKLGEVPEVCAFQRTFSSHFASLDPNDAASFDNDFRLTLSPGAPAMNVNRLVLIRIEENLHPEVFIEVWHDSTDR